MGLEELDSRKVKYSIIDTKTLSFKVDKIKLKKDMFLKFISLLYFLFMRIKDTLVELDMKIGEEKHLLVYPYEGQFLLALLVEKNSDYIYIKQNINTILK